MKKIKYLLLMLICFNLNTVDIFSAIDTNMRSVGKGITQDCEGSEICYRKVVSSVNEMVELGGVAPASNQITGVRLTLTDQNGRRVAGKSIDFIQNQSHIDYLVAAHRKAEINIISNLANPLTGDVFLNKETYQKLSKREYTAALTNAAGYGEFNQEITVPIFSSYSPYDIHNRNVNIIMVGAHSLGASEAKFTLNAWKNSFALAPNLPKYKDDFDMDGNKIIEFFDHLEFNPVQASYQSYWENYGNDDKYLVYYLKKMGIDNSVFMTLDLNNVYIMIEPVTILTIIDNNAKTVANAGGLGEKTVYDTYTFYGTVTEVYTMVRAQSYANYGDTTYLGYGIKIQEKNGGSIRSLFEEVLPTSMYIDEPVGSKVFSFNTIDASSGIYGGNMFRYDKENKKVMYKSNGYWEDIEYTLPKITPNLFFKANKSTRSFTSMYGDFYALGVGQIKFIKNKCKLEYLSSLTQKGTRYYEGNNCCEPNGYGNEEKINGNQVINQLDSESFKLQLSVQYPSFYYSQCSNNINACYYWVANNCPDNCDSLHDGSIEDKINYPSNKSEWTCIYESPSATQQIWKDFYKTTESSDYANNDYCDVFCKEEIYYTLPSTAVKVEAGRYFIVGRYEAGIPSWSPIKFEGIKTCRTTEINYSKFETDYEKADRNVLTSWDQWQYAYKTRLAFDARKLKFSSDSSCACVTGSKYVGECRDCCDRSDIATADPVAIYECENNTCPIKDVYGKDTGKYTEPYITGYKCPDTYSGSPTDSNGTCSKVICAGRCHSNYNPSYNYKVYSGYNSSSTKKVCSESINSERMTLDGNVSSKYSAYTQNKEKRSAIGESIKKCNALTANYSSFKPIIELTYENPLYGLNNSPLSISSSRPGIESRYYNIREQETTYKEDKIPFYDCGNSATGNKCTKITDYEYPKNSIVQSKYNIIHSYELNNKIYNYIQKGTNKAMLYEPVNKGGNYYKLNYGILPVSLSSKNNGKYDISLKILSFGSNSLNPDIKTNSNNKFNDLLTSNYRKYGAAKQCSPDYDCQYSTYKEIQTDDLNVVFRPISLTNPFLYKDGSVRTPKGQWKNNTKYITKNRGVNDYDVYKDKNPLYTIVLTPAAISKIREYNESVGYIYADYSLKCTDGKNCKSDFLRKDLKNMLQTPLSGCVVDDTSSRCNSGEARFK